MPKEGELWTVPEWVDMFMNETPEHREIIANKVLRLAEATAQCTIMGHHGAVKFARNHHCPPDRYAEGWQDALKTLKTEIGENNVDI